MRVRVISLGHDFDYRPLLVGEPFDRSQMTRFELEPLVHSAGAELIADALVSLEPNTRCAHLASGNELHYDALLVATGTSLDPVFPQASTVDPERMDELVQDIEEGYLHRLAVVIPVPPPCPLPAYEIALMASERAWDMQTSLDVALITPEAAPLEAFGETVTRGLSELFAGRRIEAITAAWCETVARGAHPPKIHARYLGPHLLEATEAPVHVGR